ncbi:MAG: elongation factor P [Nitrospinae bacterium]|nr:elongation factor P [Nitrospinota bacterium]
MFQTSQFRNGLKIEIDGHPWLIVEFQHITPGKGTGFVRTKLKNMRTGQVLEKTFKSGEKVKKPDLMSTAMQFLYKSGDNYVFMNTSSYEQTEIPEKALGDSKLFLKDGMECEVLLHNDEAINIELPMFVELEITQTDPGFKGDTASGGNKPATLETGAVIKVPLYLTEGERVKIDTRTGEFVERAKS